MSVTFPRRSVIDVLEDIANGIKMDLPDGASGFPVVGPVTDEQLRATPVPVAGPLTDAQLRAAAVAVSLTGSATSALQTTGNTSLASLLAAGPAVVVGNAITRVADVLPYLAGDLIANNLTAGSVTPITLGAARASNLPVQLRRARLTVSGAASPWAGATVRAHFYSSSPVSAVGDNGVFQTPVAGYLGYMDITLDQTRSDGVFGAGAPGAGGEITTLPVASGVNVFALLETRSAVTPASASIFTLTLEVWRG
ncbi:hypothetical protein [Roseococcus sp.]|uniref:hypothetical protein n=1 Tax=Roseococcus sp. TaxID=2109646 RepID=UPI003BAB87B7